jgi:hypothetical protein
MKTMLLITAAMLVALSGCVTMPDPVPDMYLAEKSDQDAKVLEKLANAIIAKNHEIKAMRDKVKDSDHKLTVEKGRLSILSDEKNLLLEKKKQYVLEKDQAKIDENQKMLVEKEIEIGNQNSKVEYSAALLEHTTALNEVREMELSVLVAELNYERARIAKAYLLKREEAGGEEGKKQKKGDALTYDEKYKKYLDKQQEQLAALKIEMEKAAVKLKMAEDKLKK